MFSSKVTLLVGGRDRTKLVPGVLKQVEVLRSTLEGSCDVPVSGVLCFIDADWALFQQPFTVDGVSVLWPKALVKTLASDGPLTPAMIAETAQFLRDRLPPA